jgi:NAD(P)-dependent dehydrogenase (short-subunit alcohol dehydrogenase family)
MELGLRKKVVVVTGASKGIGRATALAFAAEGCNIVVTARNEEELVQLAQEIREKGCESLAIPIDLSRTDAAKTIVDRTVERFGMVHVLVNNAGSTGRPVAFEELTDEDWESVFELNLFSIVRLTRAVLSSMKKQQWGRIINIASESGIQPDPTVQHYNASKAAIINLTKSLSKAYAMDGILVNTVSPGLIKTPLVEKILAEQAKAKGISQQEAEQAVLRENRPHIELKRAGVPEEVAHVIVFLASDAATFITGTNLRVDGGSVASV